MFLAAMWYSVQIWTQPKNGLFHIFDIDFFKGKKSIFRNYKSIFFKIVIEDYPMAERVDPWILAPEGFWFRFAKNKGILGGKS